MLTKKEILLLVAVVCVALYFYGKHLNKNSDYLKFLPTVGGLAFGLNTLIQIAQ